MCFKGLETFMALEPLILFLIICPIEIISNMKNAFFPPSPVSICVMISTSFGVKSRFDFSLALIFAICTMGYLYNYLYKIL